MLSYRQATILNALVSQYIHATSPGSSDSLVRQAELGVSAATLRNEMAVLEEGEFIGRPYASAGAVPSSLGSLAHAHCRARTRPRARDGHAA